ncbi:MAG: uroporphyrinogen decarboxylase family protein [Chloroflexota bacterium]|nr:uroporphyrinogen decarboxylase family protein [Chloroflexota bacterium]
MNHRERVLTAIRHQEPDRVPTALWGSAYGITDPLYYGLLDHLGLGTPVSPFRSRRGHSVNHYDDRVLEALDTDVRYVWLGFTDLGGPPAHGGLDAWGVGWEQADIYLTATGHPLAQATVEDLEEYAWPDVERLIRRDELREQARTLHTETDYAVVGRAVDSYGLFERACQMRGTTQFMIDLLTDEAFVALLLNKIGKVLERLLEIYLDTAGEYLDIMELPGDDYAAQDPLISPSLFDRVFTARWQRLIDLVNAAAPHCHILFHSDGRMEPFLTSLIEAGVDIFHCLEPLPGVDMAQIKEKYGDQLTFWGAIDIKQALQGDEARVEAEVRERIRALAPGGGYVLAPANHLQPDIPAHNIVALYKAAHRYGQYPLQL